MLDCLLYAIELQYPRLFLSSVSIKQFKIIKEFSTHAKAEVMLSEEVRYHPRLREVVARLDLSSNMGSFSAILFPEPRDIVQKRIANYNSENYVNKVFSLNDAEGEAELKNIFNFIDLMRGIVEANRQLSIIESRSLGKVEKMRWVYIVNFPLISDEEASRIQKVSFRRKTLVKNDNIYFPVKDVLITGFDEKMLPNIAFFVQAKVTKSSLSE